MVMDSNSTFVRPFDESLIRELPQFQSLRIAPLRHPVSSRGLSVPSPLEPNASTARESKASPSGGTGPTNLPTVTEFPNTAQTKKNDDSVSSLEPPPPKPILPAFVNLRALERVPFSSFDEDAHLARKRRRLDPHADTFGGDHLQLPIPQQQKEHRPPPFGPFAILNGLNEPPPNAALLPPIEAGSITQLLSKPTREDSVVEPALLTSNAIGSYTGEKREGRIDEILGSSVDDKPGEDGEQGDVDEPSASSARAEQTGNEQIRGSNDGKESLPTTDKSPEPPSPKTRGRSRKNLRKWTQEETTALLRGVVKCGIGNWTAILAQPELQFNKRSASNLKDRFRVCCPWAYRYVIGPYFMCQGSISLILVKRAADPNEATKKLHDTLANALQRAENDGSDGTAGKILLPQPRASSSGRKSNSSGGGSDVQSKNSFSSSSSLTTTEIDPNLKAQTSTPTLSNKSKSTLASLGIPEPHFAQKSRRRSRRPFTGTEDEALLKGYAVHGFQWTLIQQDKRLNLNHRKATDLRDRFRTKFPHAYREGGSVSGKSLHPKNDDSTSTDDVNPATGGKETQADKQFLSASHNSKAGCSTGRTDPVSPTLPRLAEHSKNASFGSTASPLQLDDHPTGPSSVDASWAENTLAPMLWDELG